MPENKLTPLQRVQAKAIYNFKMRQRAAEEKENFQKKVEEGTFFEEQLKPASAQVEEKKGK
jgi:hypothetical protein